MKVKVVIFQKKYGVNVHSGTFWSVAVLGAPELPMLQDSRGSGVPRAPGAPRASGAPEAPKILQMRTLGAPGALGALGAPGAPGP